MSIYTKEQIEQFPEFAQKDFVETENGFKHGEAVKLKGSLNNLDADYKETKSRLSEFEKTQEEAIKAAKQEAYEKAKKEGNLDEIEKRFKEQIEDVKKRAGETEQQFKTRLDTMVSRERDAVATEIATNAIDGGQAAVKQLLKSRIDIDPDTGKEIYLNADGSASSLDKKGFIESLKSEEMFKPLLKATVTTNGGGNVNGNNDGSANVVKVGKLDGSKSERAKYFADKFNID